MHTEQAISTEHSSTVSSRRPNDDAERRAIGLGWFSLGLGVAQLVAPRHLARLIGASDSPIACATMRAFGVREVAAGLGILGQPRPNLMLWGRVAGDLLDLGMLTQQLTTKRRGRGRLALATATVVGTTMLDLKTALDATRARRGQNLNADGVHVKHAITIRATPGQVYGFWRNLENLPKFMSHLESVKVHNGKSIWRAKAPAGTTVEWLAEIVADHPNSLISWRSLPGSEIPNRGSVRFRSAPGNQGTEVHVQIVYQRPGGALAAQFAKLFGEEPKQQIKSDLRRLKQVLETGEVLHSDASIHRGTHPAQPSAGPNVPARPTLLDAGLTEAAYSSHGSGDHLEPTRPRFLAAPPKPTQSDAASDPQRTASSDAPNDAIPYTHSTNQGSGIRDDNAS